MKRIRVLIVALLLVFSSALAGCLEDEDRSDMDEAFEEDSGNEENNTGNHDEPDIDVGSTGNNTTNNTTNNSAPIITLIGDEEIRIMVSNSSSEGEAFTDSGAICTDEEDGDLSANVSLSGMVVNVLISGEYVITYYCEDSDGNSVEVRRVVIILEWDSDGDGVPDKDDAFPDDANETSDRDGDGVGDNADAFPDDGRESADSDGDGVGDIGDQCPETPFGASVDTNGCELTAEEHFINISGMAFSPNSITISVGDNVTWTNQDGSSHTVTGDNSEFDSGTLDNGQMFSFTFTTAGTYTYHCAFHSGMTATIIVE